jgi:fucose 4-O-acetylase-like acetyltransferase
VSDATMTAAAPVEPPAAAKPGRNLQIDALRGVAMLLVVLRHVIQHDPVGSMPDVWIQVWRVIDSIDLPMFMFLAGFVTLNRVRTPEWRWLADKARRLLVPWVAWGLVLYAVGALRYGKSFGDFLWLTVLHPENGLWFLWILFWCYVLVALVHRPLGRLGVWSLVVLAVLIQLVPVNDFGVWQLKGFFPWFAAGYVVAAYRDRIRAILPDLRVAALVVYTSVFYLTLRVIPVDWELSPYIMAKALTAAGAKVLVARAVLTVCGIVLVDALVRSWRGGWIHRFVAHVGTISLGVYGAHLAFLDLPVGSGLIRLGLAFVVAVGLSVVVCDLCGRSSILSLLFLGRGRPKPHPEASLGD